MIFGIENDFKKKTGKNLQELSDEELELSLKNIKAEKELADLYNSCFSEADERKIHEDQQALMSAAYYSGRQDYNYDGKMRRFVKNPEISDASIISNYVLPAVRVLHAKLIASSPKWDIAAAKPIQESIDVADLAQDIMTNAWLNDRMSYQFARAVLQSLVLKKGYFGLYYDEESKRIKAECVDYFEVWRDPRRKEIDDGRFLIRRRFHTVDEILLNFPGMISREDIPVEGAYALEDLWKTSLGDQCPSIEQQKHEYRQGAYVNEIWIRPKSFTAVPDGIHMIVVGDKVISKNEWRDWYFPIIDLYEIETPGVEMNTNTIEQMIPDQRLYNLSKKIGLKAQKKSLGKWMAPKTSGLDTGKMTDDPDEIVMYNVNATNPASVPQHMAGPQPTQHFYETLQMAKLDMEEISGVREVSRGGNVGQKSGRAIALLQEQDEGKLTTILKLHEDRMTLIGRKYLKMAKHFYKEEQLIKRTFPNGLTKIRTFKSSDIDFADDIIIVPGSNFPVSQVVQREIIMTMATAGLLTDPKKIFRAYQAGSLEHYFVIEDPDSITALWENDQMLAGVMQEVEPFQDHKIHLDVVNEVRKSIKWKNLPDNIKEMFNAHGTEHEKYVMAQMMNLSAGQQSMNPQEQPGPGSGSNQETAIPGAPPEVGLPPEPGLEGGRPAETVEQLMGLV
jgi:hypothetical protein